MLPVTLNKSGQHYLFLHAKHLPRTCAPNNTRTAALAKTKDPSSSLSSFHPWQTMYSQSSDAALQHSSKSLVPFFLKLFNPEYTAKYNKGILCVCFLCSFPFLSSWPVPEQNKISQIKHNPSREQAGIILTSQTQNGDLLFWGRRLEKGGHTCTFTVLSISHWSSLRSSIDTFKDGYVSARWCY